MAGKKCYTEADRANAAFDKRGDATFGRAKMYAKSGKVEGKGGPVDDKVDAKLSPGEYVLPADTTAALSVEQLDAVKDATHTPAAVQKKFGMANGGLVWGRSGPSPLFDELASGVRNAPIQVFGAQPTAPPPAMPAQPQQQFGRRRSSENGWNYENGRIAMADGGVVPALKGRRARIDGAVDAAVMNTPPPADPAGKSIPEQAQEKIVKPAETMFGRIKKAIGMADGGRIPGYSVTELPIDEEIDYRKTRIPTNPNAAQTANSFGTKPPQPVNPLRTAGNAVADAQAAARPAAPAAAAKPGFFGTAARAVGGALRAATGAVAGGVLAATHSEDVGAQSDGSQVGLTRPGALQVSPAGAALGDTEQYRLMAELNNPRTHPQRQAQIRELMVGKNPTPATAAPVQADNSVMYDPTPGIELAARGQPAAPALASLGIDTKDERGATVRNARPNAAGVNLGDYGGDGQTIFGKASKPGGKIDTFEGVGGGTNKATGYAPKGVDFGIKPGDVEKYKADLAKYSQLGGPPRQGTAAYKDYAQASAQYDAVKAQEAAYGRAAQVDAIRAGTERLNAMTDAQKAAAEAAAAVEQKTYERAAQNARDLDSVLDNSAKMGLPGLEKVDPVQLAAALKVIANTRPLQIGNRKVLYKDLDPAERSKYFPDIVAAVRPQFANEGFGGGAPRSITGQTGDLRPSTFGERISQATGGDIAGAFSPTTGKSMTAGDNRFHDKKNLSKEEIEKLERQKKS